jgi:hypothetical protein
MKIYPKNKQMIEVDRTDLLGKFARGEFDEKRAAKRLRMEG